MSRPVRYRPARFGIVGLYEYADQEFAVEDGRLALRGRNTSGKSKALELLVPFVLDGDITPRKLDPFASSAKTMRWNLIECTDAYDGQRVNKRVGYVWAEFVRDPDPGAGPDAGREYLTCGIGLEATRGSDGVRGRWYFTTRQRIGADLHLTRPTLGAGSEPIVRAALAEQLAAGGGALHDGPAAYKEALRAELLPFATAPLYEQALDVIRLLRKPKLSDSLNVSGLSKMLSGALPPVDETLVRRLGDALEQLHELQRQHDELQAARAEVAATTEKEYRSYARGVVAHRAERLRRADGEHERARSGARSAADALAAAELARETAEGSRAAVEREHTRVHGEYEELLQSDAYRVIAVLGDRERERDAAAERAGRAEEALERSRAARDAADAALADAAARAGTLAEAVRISEQHLAELLRAVGLEPVTGPAALAALPGRLAVRAQDVARGRELAGAAAAAAMRGEAVAEPLARATDRREQASAVAAELALQVDMAVEAQLASLRDWRGTLREFVVDDEQLDAVADAAIDEDGDAVALVAALAVPRSQELALTRARTGAAREQVARERAEAEARAAAIDAQRDPEPAPRAVRPPDRVGRAGAPLWAVCDFRTELEADQRAGVEAALEDAGLLDAWVSPDGDVHDGDRTLVARAEAESASEAAAAPAPAGTLADLLIPDPAAGDAVPPRVVTAILRALPLEGAVSVAPGRFRFGPLHGRGTKGQPEFIGAAARAARRERLLAEARAAVAALEERLVVLDAELAQLEAAERRVADEQAALPAVAALRAAQRGRRRADDRLQNAEAELARAITARDDAERAHGAAHTALTDHARATGLPADAAGLEAAAAALGRAALTVAQLEQAVAAAADGAGVLVRRRDETAKAEEAQQAARTDADRATVELDEAEGRLAAARAADGATAAELQDRATVLRARRSELDDSRRRAGDEQLAAVGALKDAERAAERAEEAVRAAETERTGALAAVRVLGRHDLFSAAVGRDAAPEDEQASGEWSLTTALERLRALPALDAAADADLGRRASRVGEAVSRLQRKLSFFDMNAATYSEDDITLVEVTREGRRTTPIAMLTELDGDLEHREQVLSAKRREVLGRALLGEIAEHLRQRVTAVRTSVRARNETLRRCPTGAGRTVSLSWDADEDAGAPAAVLALFGDRATENLPERDRETLFAFLHQRIADARAGAADEAAQTAIADHLAVALDYRRWWRFTLHLHERDGSTQKLTARTQGLGSGGEQSVLMHLPLFATAAQLYDLAPGGPRIVALDEAMDGIDPPTREQMFALLVALDLDWVMTSYDIDPCVATNPRVGFYELHRDNAEWGVWAQHFVWDGAQVTELVDG